METHIMTKNKALYEYFNNYNVNIPAYRNTAVTEDAVLPYLTYSYIDGGIDDQPTSIEVNMWFHTESEAIPDEYAEEFRQYILDNGEFAFDKGYIEVYPGEPWCQALEYENDHTLKRRFFNVTLQHINR